MQRISGPRRDAAFGRFYTGPRWRRFEPTAPVPGRTLALRQIKRWKPFIFSSFWCFLFPYIKRAGQNFLPCCSPSAPRRIRC